MDLYSTTAGPADAATTLVFMHGSGILDHTCFRPWTEPLATDHQLVFYDARLCGRSARTSASPLTFDMLADDANRVAADAGGKAIAVAHSWPALVAVAAAARTDSPFRGLILVTPGMSPTLGQTVAAHVAANAPTCLPFLTKAFAGDVVDDDELKRGWRALLPLYFARPDEQVLNALADGTRFSAVGFNAFLTSGFHLFDWRAAAANLRIPTLVVAGAHDWIERDPAGGSRPVTAAIRQSSFHLFKDSSHFPYIEEPDAFVSVVRDWARSVAG